MSGVNMAASPMESSHSPSADSVQCGPRCRRQQRLNAFDEINERQVDDVCLTSFYRPHTISLLVGFIVFLIYFAFTRDDHRLEDNIKDGLFCVLFFFMIISVLAFPNGPFTRPHPALWRMVFGMSVLYLMFLIIALFQSFETLREIQYSFYPELRDFHIDSEKEYGVDCWNITWEKIWSHCDVFAVGHFVGWTMKAVLIRHYGICWTISVTWEITEMAFAHLLPNFVECWWDAFILDVLICNGLGIWFGMQICRFLEMRTYKWECIKDIDSISGKLRRAVLQFTPQSMTKVSWLDPASGYVRILAVTELVIFWQITELNTFFLKHIFEVPPDHPLSLIRLALVSIIVAPAVRQFYSYVTNTRVKRVGTQCWVFGAIMMTEALVCIKFGLQLFKLTQVRNIIIWLIIQFGLSCVCVYMCVWWQTRCQKMQLLRRANERQPGNDGDRSEQMDLLTVSDDEESRKNV
ncbi:phosphatidylserine synthase 1-like [Varroa destructor]|uniref:Phosphatidylserine synthase n=1 Tax=Varroa destructor TaxID=109461 RepID=A0A7M7JTL4_VARDE|nr:phosphatidylserine synthase 1-like [Varroa destructor]XP_022652253.1 phosphatidylserine synthase 1-like [Varroa destructor]XP_022652254.1 phosphatidylserine synthase 1-like [Varroa destructor]XP_022652255.1 phosphatidylserine synthase 1-like [Varroa destructor]XP_022652256.1 phosphatidylserine synthase 1-like [Varroa destructor]XP_022652257.1 phosphatidylserine synthase 1-like [Varroa destructor]